MCNFVGAVFTVFWFSLHDAEKGDVVPHQQWVHGVGVGELLLARVMVFESPNEDDQRCAEMVVYGYCKEKCMVLLNPKNMDGSRTKNPVCNFAVGVEVLCKGGLGPELQQNEKHLETRGGKFTTVKWGNSSSDVVIMQADVRLLRLVYNQSPPTAYEQPVKFLQNVSSTNNAGKIPRLLRFG